MSFDLAMHHRYALSNLAQKTIFLVCPLQILTLADLDSQQILRVVVFSFGIHLR